MPSDLSYQNKNDHIATEEVYPSPTTSTSASSIATSWKKNLATAALVVGAGLTLTLTLTHTATHRYRSGSGNGSDDNNNNDTLGECFGKKNATSSYACPDTTGTTMTSIELPWGGVSFNFSKQVTQWDTPSKNFVNFINKDVFGAVLAVLHTNGTCAPTHGERPFGPFYMCGPLKGIDGAACTATICGPHAHADYEHTGWDRGHLVSNHEGGLFANDGGEQQSGGGEQQTFSMCNIWPQGKQFNEKWWQRLEYTCDGYAINKECLILTGPIFAKGTNTCMGLVNSTQTRATSKTTGPTVPCDATTTRLPIPIPSHFFKILIDLEQKIYWTFLATNDAGPVEQLVPDMVSTLAEVKTMSGLMAITNLEGYEEQSSVDCYVSKWRLPEEGAEGNNNKCGIDGGPCTYDPTTKRWVLDPDTADDTTAAVTSHAATAANPQRSSSSSVCSTTSNLKILHSPPYCTKGMHDNKLEQLFV